MLEVEIQHALKKWIVRKSILKKEKFVEKYKEMLYELINDLQAELLSNL